MNPFTHESIYMFKTCGEVALLNQIINWIVPVSKVSPMGVGDDCAVIMPSQKKQLWTTDSLVYGVHFDDQATPVQAGEKLLKRNLSDIAAMGGMPTSAVISLFLSEGVDVRFLEGFYRGCVAYAQKWGVNIVGGDVTGVKMPFFGATMSLLGSVDYPKTRLGGEVGDSVWVTGRLGGSLAGHHLAFEPRLKEGQFLATADGVKAMMDLTDGLAKDGYALCGIDKSLSLSLNNLPITSAAYAMSEKTHKPAWEHALCDGEDYELLFVLDKQVCIDKWVENWHKVFDVDVTCIGHLALLNGKNAPYIWDAATGNALLFKGYEH